MPAQIHPYLPGVVISDRQHQRLLACGAYSAAKMRLFSVQPIHPTLELEIEDEDDHTEEEEKNYNFKKPIKSLQPSPFLFEIRKLKLISPFLLRDIPYFS